MDHSRRKYLYLLLTAALLAPSVVRAADERVFTEARSGKAELKYINDLPVLTVAGTPQEIGRQKAVLTEDVIKKIADYPKLLLERASRKDRLPQYLEMSKVLTQNIPADYREEMRAFADHSGMDRDMGMLANTLADIYRGAISCSSLIVAPKRARSANRCSAAISISTPWASSTNTAW